MAKITSINEFEEAVAKIALSRKEDFFTVTIKNTTSSIKKNLEFSVYINGFGSADGRTPEEAIRNLKIKMGIIKVKNVDLKL